MLTGASDEALHFLCSVQLSYMRRLWAEALPMVIRALTSPSWALDLLICFKFEG